MRLTFDSNVLGVPFCVSLYDFYPTLIFARLAICQRPVACRNNRTQNWCVYCPRLKLHDYLLLAHRPLRERVRQESSQFFNLMVVRPYKGRCAPNHCGKRAPATSHKNQVNSLYIVVSDDMDLLCANLLGGGLPAAYCRNGS